MPGTRPNILFILADQHNAKVLGHAGHPSVKTPNLDRLATGGVRFSTAITQSPICTPSRVSFLSGQYCHNHGYYGLSGPNPAGLPSMIGHFRRHGYLTAAIGKIHCPEYWIEDDCDIFEEVYENCSIGARSGYSEYLQGKGLFHLRDDAMGYGRDRVTVPGQQFDGRKSDLDYRDSVEAWIARKTIEFMAAAKRDGRPFIVHTSLPRPHARYIPSEPFWSMYDESTIALPPNADYDMSGKAPHLRAQAARFRTGDWALFEPRTFEAARLRKLHGYLGCVSQVDHSVGELLDWLAAEELDDNTIVIYSSDHGDYACEHGLMEKAPGICSDAITRIPLIWRWPGHFAFGHQSNEIVETVDLAPTLCKLADVPVMETADGRDISELLAGGNEPVRDIGITESAWSKSVRKGRYRLVYYPPDMFPDTCPDGFGELYDMEQDPWEMQNLFFEPDYRQTVAELQGDLLRWLVTSARPRTVLPAVHLDGEQAMTRYRNSTLADGKLNPSYLRRGAKSYL